MVDEETKARKAALEARLEEIQAAQKDEKPHQEEHYSQAQTAWRMVIELVAGLLIGVGVGYVLDGLLGTRPWLMIVFTFLGFAAGVKTVIRTAQELQNTQADAEAAKRKDEGN